MPGLSPQGIFLSYRRADGAPYARLLQLQLRERIPDAPIFMDLDSIDPGLDFAEVIREAVDSCAVLIALIGRQWATLADEEGRRRLDNSDDLVRFEIQTALERGIRVIPVLVDGAKPLRQEQLPSELRKLARLNALELSYGRYEYDADRLLVIIQQVLDQVSGPESKVSQGDQARAARILADAVHLAQSITDEGSRAQALAEIGRALAASDPDEAAQLIADAERIAQSVTNDGSKASALIQVVEALAAIDPDRAERLAQSITYKGSSVRVDARIARALAVIDPDEAARRIESAYQIGGTFFKMNSWELAEVVSAMAAIDLDRAESMVQRITKEPWKGYALFRVVEAVAVADPDRAELITQSITSKVSKARALAEVARALAAADPDRAAQLVADVERITKSIADKRSKDYALVGVARALAAIDPDRAERIALSITIDGFWRIEALVAIAETWSRV